MILHFREDAMHAKLRTNEHEKNTPGIWKGWLADIQLVDLRICRWKALHRPHGRPSLYNCTLHYLAPSFLSFAFSPPQKALLLFRSLAALIFHFIFHYTRFLVAFLRLLDAAGSLTKHTQNTSIFVSLSFWLEVERNTMDGGEVTRMIDAFFPSPRFCYSRRDWEGREESIRFMRLRRTDDEVI